MPREFGLRGLRGFGSHAVDPIAGYRPTQAEIDAAEAEQREPSSNAFFEALRIPSRLLGGPMIQALLAGDMEGAVRNNPIYQAAQLLLPEALEPEFIQEKRYSFADVRAAHGVDIESGVGAFVTDFVGEVLTDPLGTMWNPFGKTAAAVTNAVKMPGSVLKAVEQGSRALFAFKVPFKNMYFHFQPFKSIDSALARQVDAAARWFNTSPFVVPLRKMFGAPVPQTGDLEVVNQWNKALGATDRASDVRGFQALYELGIHRLVHKHPEAVRDPRMMEAINLWIELGIDKADDLGTIYQKIEGGVPFVKARNARDKLLASTGIPEAKALAHDMRVAMGVGTGAVGDAGAWVGRGGTGPGSPGVLLVEEWQRRFGRASLPKEVLDIGAGELERRGVVLRAGIDTVDPFRGRVTPLAQKLGPGQAVESAGVTNRFSGPTPPLVDNAGQAARYEDALLKETRLQSSVSATVDRTKDLFESLFENKSDFAKVADAAVDVRSFFERIGQSDVLNQVLTTTLENYVPRDLLNPAVARMLNAQWAKFDSSRKFTDLTISEVNDLVWKHGSKLTNYKPLEIMTKNAQENSIQGVMAKIFNSDFIKGLRKLGDEGQAAAEFFGTNPALQMQRRLQASVRIRHRMHMAQELVADDSPMVLHRSKLSDVESNATRAFDTGQKAFILDRRHGQVTELPASELLGPGLMVDERAQASLARMNLASYVHENIAAGTKSSVALLSDFRKDLDLNIGASRALLEGSGTPLARNLLEQQELAVSLAEDKAVAALDKYIRGGGGGHITEADITKLQLADNKETARLLQALEGSKGVRSPDNAYARRLLEQLKRPRVERAEYMAELRKHEEVMRASVREHAGNLDGHLRAVWETAKDSVGAKAKSFDEFVKQATDDIALRDRLDAYVLSREAGHLAIDDLARVNPGVHAELVKSMPDTEVLWMDPEVHQSVFGKGGAMDQLYHPQHAMHAGGVVGWMARAWKAWTFMPPVFLTSRLRDVVSSNLMHAQGGASPIALAAAATDSLGMAKALGAHIRGDSHEMLTKVMTNGTESYSVAELFDKGFASGVLNFGALRDEVTISGAQAVVEALPKFKDAPGKWIARMFHYEPQKNTFLGLGGELMEFLDNTTKFQATLAHWKGGKTLDEALELTKKFAYDPRNINMSSFEKNRLRHWIPMWTWFRHTVTSQTEAYFKRPGTVTWFEKVHKSAVSAAGMSEAEFEAFMPNFVKDQFGIPTKVTKEGVEVRLFGGYFPIGALGEMVSALEATVSGDPARGLDWAGKQLHPLVRVPIETALNRSFYSRRPLETAPGAKVEMFGLSLSPLMGQTLSNMRLLSEIDRLNVLNFGDFSRLFDGVARPQRGGQGDSFLDKLARTSFVPLPPVPGARGYSISAKEQLHVADAKVQQEANMVVSNIRRTLEHKKAGSPTAEDNLDALKTELTKKLGKREIIEDLYKRFGITP